MGVLNPIKLIIDNYPTGQTEEVEAINNPEDPQSGTRKVTFGKELYIDSDDFALEPPKGFYRMSPGKEVRLKAAYYVTCTDVTQNEDGSIKEIHCTYDPDTKGGTSNDGRKVKGTLHWVNANDCLHAQVRLYESLFTVPNPSAQDDFLTVINPDSFKQLQNCKIEKSIKNAPIGEVVQFERLGYFCIDKDSKENNLVITRTIGLKDTWNKIKNR